MFLIEVISVLVALFFLLLMIRDDWREREVKAWHMAYFAFALNAFFIRQIGIKLWLDQLILNELIVGIYLITIVGYLLVKRLPWRQLFQSYFGLGDVLFLVALAPCFAPQFWLGVTITCFLSAALLHLLFRKNENDTVPFVSYGGIVAILAFGVQYYIQTYGA
ncbi:MAG: hypothetical protein MK081_15650 [Flavobacteriales bacterium]|nr:hypothetical protein [Flavobacteriales bacterium]